VNERSLMFELIHCQSLEYTVLIALFRFLLLLPPAPTLDVVSASPHTNLDQQANRIGHYSVVQCCKQRSCEPAYSAEARQDASAFRGNKLTGN
jgi:hypothetical protein